MSTQLEIVYLISIIKLTEIYLNHLEQVRTQLSRVPQAYSFPTLRLNRADSIDSYQMDDIDASDGYRHHPTIKAPVAV